MYPDVDIRGKNIIEKDESDKNSMMNDKEVCRKDSGIPNEREVLHPKYFEEKMIIEEEDVKHNSVIDYVNQDSDETIDLVPVKLELDKEDQKSLKENENDQLDVMTDTIVTEMNDSEMNLLPIRNINLAMQSEEELNTNKGGNDSVDYRGWNKVALIENTDELSSEVDFVDSDDEDLKLFRTKAEIIVPAEERITKKDCTTLNRLNRHDVVNKKSVQYVPSKIDKLVTRRDGFKEFTERPIWNRYVEGEPIINRNEIQDHTEEYWDFMSLSDSDSSEASTSSFDSLFEDVNKMIKHDQRYKKSNIKRESVRRQEKYGYYSNTDNDGGEHYRKWSTICWPSNENPEVIESQLTKMIQTELIPLPQKEMEIEADEEFLAFAKSIEDLKTSINCV